ncbi:MAG: glycosyltransferase family 9 protein [Mariprofundaceae bacterium]|nr:glycosyltransferase family 9 protein [Mariprofundaceae bacterium]
MLQHVATGMNILIVKLSAFGDIIHAIPAMETLRQRGVSVHWLVDARYAFVTELFPKDVHVHVVALKGERRFHHALQAIGELRKLCFDAVLDLQGLIKSGIIAKAASQSAPVYGFDRQETPEWPNHWFITPVSFHPDERHVVQKYMRIASAPFDTPDDAIVYAPPRISINETQHAAAASIVASWKNKPHTLLHVGGGWQTKRLDLQQWKELINGLHERGASITLSWGNESELHRARRIVDGYGLATVLPERLNIHALAGVLHAAEAVIGMDTGVLHLAAALGAPTVTLWGPSASWNAAPLGKSDAHIESKPACGPCFQRRCECFICLPSIKPERIVDAWAHVKEQKGQVSYLPSFCLSL